MVRAGIDANMWVEVVISSLLCSGFPLSSKTNISKFQLDQESGRRSSTVWMSYLSLVIYLFNGKFLGEGGGVLGLFFSGYVPLASLSPYPIMVYSKASYRPHLSHFWANV